MRIDFLVGDNQYASTRYFSNCFAAALERQGVKTRLFDIGEGRFFEAFYAISADPPDLTCSFSDITLGDGLLLGDQWQIPHLSFLIDPFIYYLHHARGRYSLLTCVDRGDVAAIKNLGFEKAFFLPHGVDRALEGERERPYEVVMLGTLRDYEAARKKWPKDSPLHRAAERVLSPGGVSCLEALIEEGVTRDLPLMHHELDLYISSKDRTDLVNSLGKVDVWGEGPWEKYCPKACVHGPISFIESLEVMKRTKCLLNSAPRFKNGSHERLFHGLMCGALVLSGNNPYIKESLPGLPTYEYGCYKDLQVAYNQDLAQSLREHVLAHHTWDTRAIELQRQICNGALG